MTDVEFELVDVPGTVDWTVVETLRRGWRASPELRHGALLTVALAFAGTAGRLILPIFLQLSIDHGMQVGQVDMGLIVRYAGIGVVVAMVSQAAAWWATLRLGRQGEAALRSLRLQVFAHFHRLSAAQLGDFRRGVLVARVTSDLEKISQFLTWGGLVWLLDVTLMIVTAVVMIVQNAALAAIVILVSAPLVLLLRRLQGRLLVLSARARDRNGEFLSSVSDLVAGAATLRVYGAEHRRANMVNEASQRLRRASVSEARTSALLFPTGELFASIAIAALVVVGVLGRERLGLTAGSLVGFIFLAYRFLEPIADLTEVIDQTQSAVTGWKRALGLLTIEPGIPAAAAGASRSLPAGPPSIELRDVSLRYAPRAGTPTQDSLALEQVSAFLEPESLTAVVGATGSGKSTLARLLARLIDPTDGAVFLHGEDLRNVDDASLRQSVVLVPQEPFLFNTTIALNIELGRPGTTHVEVAQAFAELGLDDWLASMPDGLDTAVGERGEQLSAGERQLVALVRAWIAAPTCLILDEATSSVDSATDAMLSRVLSKLADGRTSVIIAHRLSTASRANRILVFDEGRLVEDGPHDQILALGGVYDRLWRAWLQASGSTN